MTQKDLCEMFGLAVLTIPEQAKSKKIGRLRIFIVICVKPLCGEDGGPNHVCIQVLPYQVAELGDDQRLWSRRRHDDEDDASEQREAALE